MLLVLPSEHPLAERAERAELGLAELADADWIVGCDRCRAHTLDRCADAGFTPTVRHVSDDYVVVQNLVATGLGVTLLPQSALEAYRHPGCAPAPGSGCARSGSCTATAPTPCRPPPRCCASSVSWPAWHDRGHGLRS